MRYSKKKQQEKQMLSQKVRGGVIGFAVFLLGFLGLAFFTPKLETSLVTSADETFPLPAVTIKNDSQFFSSRNMDTVLFFKTIDFEYSRGNPGGEIRNGYLSLNVIGAEPQYNSHQDVLKAGDSRTVDFGPLLYVGDTPISPDAVGIKPMFSVPARRLTRADITVVNDYQFLGVHIHAEKRYIASRDIRGKLTFTEQARDQTEHHQSTR